MKNKKAMTAPTLIALMLAVLGLVIAVIILLKSGKAADDQLQTLPIIGFWVMRRFYGR